MKEVKAMQKWYKSKVVWAGIFAQVLIVIGIFMPQISDTVKIVGTAVLEIATLIGLVNNPTNPTGIGANTSEQ